MSDPSGSRRDFLRWGAAGAAIFSSGGRLFARVRDREIPLSVQLYSVRDACGKDFDAALQEIASMGFQGVEFAGYYKYAADAKGLRKKLDDLGLKVAGAHLRADLLAGDELKKSIDFHKEIGCRFLIVPMDARFVKPDESKVFAELMNVTAEKLKPEGLFCGYHNHTVEFTQKDGGKTYWDLFAERTSANVILQLDAGHSNDAGVDSAAYVRKYPGRTKSTHIKGRLPEGTQGKKPIIGQDAADWKSYLTACTEVGSTEWFIVEQEQYPDGRSPMECTKLSLEGLKKILSDPGK